MARLPSSRFSLLTDFFWIQPSNQLVYIPDDGSIEFAEPSRSYGFEVKTMLRLTSRMGIDGGITKVLNAYYRDTQPRIYLDSAPRFTANAGLTVSDWRGWSGSLRMRAINHYRLDGENPSILASGHTVFDFALSRRLRQGLELTSASTTSSAASIGRRRTISNRACPARARWKESTPRPATRRR